MSLIFPYLTLQALGLGLTYEDISIIYGISPVIALAAGPIAGEWRKIWERVILKIWSRGILNLMKNFSYHLKVSLETLLDTEQSWFSMLSSLECVVQSLTSCPSTRRLIKFHTPCCTWIWVQQNQQKCHTTSWLFNGPFARTPFPLVNIRLLE